MQSQNMVITGSDDQTVKVWNLLEIKNSKPPNKKKPRLAKDGKEDNEDEEDGDEIEDEHEGGHDDHPIRDRRQSQKDYNQSLGNHR